MHEFDDAFIELRGRPATVDEQREGMSLGSVYKRYPALDPLAILVILTGRIPEHVRAAAEHSNARSVCAANPPQLTQHSARSKNTPGGAPKQPSVSKRDVGSRELAMTMPDVSWTNLYHRHRRIGRKAA